MKVAIFGGTGRTGKLVVKEALARAWEVRLLVRDPSKLERSDLSSVVIGDARSLPHVSQTLEGDNAVFACLALSDSSVPSTDLSDSLKTILRAMAELGVERILSIASAGELDHPDGGYRNKEGLPEFLRHVTADQIRGYEALRDSRSTWTLICPLWLKDDIPAGNCRYAFEDLPAGSEETGYADLARTMADLVDNPESYRKRVGIASYR